MKKEKGTTLAPLKPLGTKRSGKKEREHRVLIGLVELFLRTGKPIGSNTLRENGFEDLSSATIRNYFARLEEGGFLSQQHSSGGRSPTHLAYRTYAREVLDSGAYDHNSGSRLSVFDQPEDREIARFLQQIADQLSQVTGGAVFVSAPRFDHDFIQESRLVFLDCDRCLCVLITDFGLVHTEVLRSEEVLTPEIVEQMEAYFHWRFTGIDKPEEINETLAQQLYNEVMVRYLVGYTNFGEEDLYRTGFSQLLAYPEFQDAVNLAGGLALFENPQGMRLLLRECCAGESLRCWIGDDLNPYTIAHPDCAVIAAPYWISQGVAGGIGVLGPVRIPYRDLFGMLTAVTEEVTAQLTRRVQKFRIQYRQPDSTAVSIEQAEKSEPILLENKTDAEG